jgi:hypothetical protein
MKRSNIRGSFFLGLSGEKFGLSLLGAPEADRGVVGDGRIDFFENTLPVYSYLSRSVRDSDILSPLSRLLRSSIPTNDAEIIEEIQVTNLTK